MKWEILSFIVFELLKHSLIVLDHLLKCLDDLMLGNVSIDLSIDMNLVLFESWVLQLKNHFEGLLVQIDVVLILVNIPQQYILEVAFLNFKTD